MPFNVTPQQLQRAVQTGFKRLENFRRTRVMLLRNYTGQYFDKSRGKIGTEALNLTFNAIRVLVPNIVMKEPETEVSTDFAGYRDYGDMLAMALTAQGRDINIRDIYRRWVVDSLFCMGILKTGLCESSSLIAFEEDDRIDPGSIYSELVDFDDFVFDASARALDQASFLGDTVRASRTQLLDSGLYKNDLLERVPTIARNRKEGSEDLSKGNVSRSEAEDLHDNIELVELWVPRAHALVTVPRETMNLTDYLRVTDYYGPDEGPYTFLKMTPPVPNNPMPVAPVGIWADLHVLANRMVHKIVTQADRQKDIIGYRRSAADDAQEALDAKDGQAVAMEDVDGVKTFSFGGQARSNEAHIAQLQMWFNMMSGNPEALGGIRSDAGTATQAEILQANAGTGIEDMRDIVYMAAAEENRKRGWYMHVDPLIEVPLTKRIHVPAKFSQGPMGPQLSEPARIDHQQIVLTPEARRGDFLNYHYKIRPRSMSRMDPRLQARNTMEFLVKAVPAAMQAAMLSAQMGVPMSFPKLLIRMARDQYDLEWFDEIFYDPEFQETVAAIMQQTPGMAGSQGTLGKGLAQNGQPATLPKVQSPKQQQRSQQQQGAVPAQEIMQTNERI